MNTVLLIVTLVNNICLAYVPTTYFIDLDYQGITKVEVTEPVTLNFAGSNVNFYHFDEFKINKIDRIGQDIACFNPL